MENIKLWINYQNGAAFLIDEVQTGGGTTGEFWCHDHFNLEHPVDIVTYSKKMLVGGYFSLPEFRWVKHIPVEWTRNFI